MSGEKSERDQLWATDDANKPSQYRNVGFIENKLWVFKIKFD